MAAVSSFVGCVARAAPRLARDRSGRLELTRLPATVRSTPVVAKTVRARAPARAVAVCSADATSSRRQARRCPATAFFGNRCYRRLAHALGSPSLSLLRGARCRPGRRDLWRATGGARACLAAEPASDNRWGIVLPRSCYQRIARPAARIRCAARRDAAFAAREPRARTLMAPRPTRADAARACVVQALGLAALSAVFFAAPKAHAGLTEDLLARTSANKVRPPSTPARAAVAPDRVPGRYGTRRPACTGRSCTDLRCSHLPGLSWASACALVVPVRC